MKPFEEIEHTADWAFRAYGSTLAELFENAARALFTLEGAVAVPKAVTRVVHVEGIDYESLLVNWLGELIYLQEAHGETYDEFHMTELTPTALAAQIEGAPATPLNKYIKAVTYHNLEIKQTPEGWQATVVVDV